MGATSHPFPRRPFLTWLGDSLLLRITNWQEHWDRINSGSRRHAVLSALSNIPGIRFLLLSTLVTGAMLPLFLMGGLSGQGPATAHAQTPVSCEKATDPPTVVAEPRSPGAKARYTLEFLNGDVPLQAEQDGIVLLLDSEIQLPREIKADKIEVHYECLQPTSTPSIFGAGKASSVEVKGPSRRDSPTEVTIFPKIVEGSQSRPIPAKAKVEVVIKEEAGISNPIEGGAYRWDVGTTHDSGTFPSAKHPDLAVRNAFERMESAIDDHVDQSELNGLLIDWAVELGDATVRRGDQLQITARGFAVGTTVIFWRDSNMDGVFNARGAILCRAESDAQAVARCSIPITNPPFVPGFGNCTLKLFYEEDENPPGNCNFINARDGEGHTSILVLEEGVGDPKGQVYNVEDAPQMLLLAGTIKLGTVLRTHPTVRVDLLDMPPGRLESLRVGGFNAELGGLSNRQIPDSGRLSFPLVLPDHVLPGLQDIQVTICEPATENSTPGACDEGEREHEHHSKVEFDNSITVDVTPDTVLPNQEVRVLLQGFQGAEITRISVDGVPLFPRTLDGNAGYPIPLDRSGRWVGSVVLPVNGSTLIGGERKLQVRDLHSRLGEAPIVFPTRSIQVSPDRVSPGDTVTISGEGFPVSNNRGSQIPVEVTYDYGVGQATTTVSIGSDGTFTHEMTVPRSVQIPSANPVSATFVDDEGHTVYTTFTHQVRAATVSLAPDHGPPGTTVKVTGQDFRPFTPVAMVSMGGIDLTPAPAPYTDRDGMMEFEVLVPQSEVGVEPVLVLAGGIYVLADFQVSRSQVETGPVTDIEDLGAILGDGLVAIFHFGNDTKEWTFYDPLLQEDSNLEFLVPGEVYYIRVSEDTEAILNGKTRYLSCQEDNCWNQMVW